MDLFGQKLLYSGKICCILPNWLHSNLEVVVFGQELLSLGKSGCIRAKVVVFGQRDFTRVKMALSNKSGCIRA